MYEYYVLRYLSFFTIFSLYTQQIKVRLEAIKSAFLSHSAYTPFHFSRTLPFILFLKGLHKRNFKWPSMQRWECLGMFISSSFSFIFLQTRNEQVTFADKPQIKMKSLKKQKHKKIIHFWSDKVFKSTLVNRALPSLHGGVTWNYAYSPFNFQNYFKASYLVWMTINLPWGHIKFVLGSAVFTFIAIVNSNQSQQWNEPNELAKLYFLTRKSG